MPRFLGGPIKRGRGRSVLGDAMASDGGREIGERRRRDRLAAALRENLKRRKVQQRGRADGVGAASGRSPDDQAAPGASPPPSGNGEG